MNWKWIQQTNWRLSPLQFAIVLLLILGVWFRFANLDQKVCWGDEIISSFRMAGYTQEEVDRQLFNCEIHSPAYFQHFQHLTPDRTLSDTLHSLVVEAPEHAPLYFTIGRFWQQLFGDSLFVRRSLPVLINLLAIPAIYWLCYSLFASHTTAGIAAGLLAISPFQILYAQEVREYSLWTLTILFSSAALLSAMARQTTVSWGIYALSLAMGFYTYMFSALVAIAQAVYLIYTEGWRLTQIVKQYLLALVAAILVFLPWGLVIAIYFGNIQSGMEWTGKKAKNMYVICFWILNLVSNFVEFRDREDPFTFRMALDRPLTYYIIFILALVCYAIYWLCRQKRIWTFVLMLMAGTVFPLLLPDIIFGGQRTSIGRYLIPCYLSIQLAVAYLFASKIADRSRITRQFWKLVMLIVIASGVTSGVLISHSQTAWTKYTDYYNDRIAAIVNQAPSPLLIGDITLNTTQSRLMSLSYLLKPEARIQGFLPENLHQFDGRGFSDIFLLTVRREEPLPAILMQHENYHVELLHLWDMSYKRRKIRLWKVTPIG